MVVDTNNPITIVMMADRRVTAVFKCGGGGSLPPVGIVLVVLGLFVSVRNGKARA